MQVFLPDAASGGASRRIGSGNRARGFPGGLFPVQLGSLRVHAIDGLANIRHLSDYLPWQVALGNFLPWLDDSRPRRLSWTPHFHSLVWDSLARLWFQDRSVKIRGMSQGRLAPEDLANMDYDQ